jgi:hypothetical protein
MKRSIAMAKTSASTRTAAQKPAEPQYNIQGDLVFDYGLPAADLTVRLYNVGFGGKATKLGQGESDNQGHYSISYAPPALGANLEVRAVDAQGKETTLSTVKYNAQAQETLNLVVPSGVQPLAPEYDRLSADMDKYIGGIANLAKAQENSTRQDLSLLYENTGWDARLVALASTAVSQSKATGLAPNVLYALYRTGLPTDPQKLALLPAATVAKGLASANQSGLVKLTGDQISSAQRAFTDFSTQSKLSLKIAGATSSFQDLLGKTFADSNLQSAFLNLAFDPTITSGAELWQKASAAGIPAQTISTLQLQGKLSLLTFNNAGLAQNLQQQLGATANLSDLADKDYYLDTTWTSLLNSVAGNNPQALQALIPSIYGGSTTADQLEAYAADLARKVRVSFPTQVVARMVENNSLPLPAAVPVPGSSNAQAAQPSVAQGVTAFLRSAAAQGYQMGKTPLNAFLKNPPKGVTVPTDPATVKWIKNLHRLYQITPSNESLQAAVKLGFTSARDVTSISREKFVSIYGSSFPSLEEAKQTYMKAQSVNSAVVGIFAMAKQLDTLPGMTVINNSASAVVAAKNAIAQQYPTMANLFGSQDYCECDDCSSVLSPAAYLVSILQFIDTQGPGWQAFLLAWQNSHSGQTYPNPTGTPYSVLTARRPDLPNLNLSCENTNTALPYIDVVNEILEYYIANNGSLVNTSANPNLGPSAAYDTGSADSADLIAEPQNILPAAYTVLGNQNSNAPALYPLGLPFDLWIETVRGFLGYFNITLAKVLDVFRSADNLELFTDSNNYPYYRASIFAEQLGISPAEYAIYTDTNALNPSNPTASQDWYQFYGYYGYQYTGIAPATIASAAAAELGGSAQTLADTLEVSYQDLANLVDTGFLNPGLAPLMGPLQEFGLSLNDVFSYTGQPGFTALSSTALAAFEQKLQNLINQYYLPNNTVAFRNPAALKTWLNWLLTGGYSNQALVLQAPSSNGCDFQDTTFQYAGGNPAQPLDFLKLNLFVRLWNKLGCSIDELDQALQVFLTPLLPATTDANFGSDFASAMKTALVYLAHLQALFTQLQQGSYDRTGILPLWGNIPTTGANPLYSQIFLTPGVLNSDPIFDDPAGQYLSYYDTTSKTYLPFRWSTTQTTDDPANGYVLLGNHATALQGALGLSANDVAAILADYTLQNPTTPLTLANAPLTLANVSLLYRYAFLAQGLQLSVSDFIALKQMSGLNPFTPLKTTPLAVLADDYPWNQTLKFVEVAGYVQQSGFTVSQLQYLLGQYDPTDQYTPDPSAQLQQVAATAAAIQSIQSQNAVPSDPTAFTDALIQQKMALVFPAPVAQTFMGMWSGTIQYTATSPSVTQANSIPPSILPGEPEIQFSYDPVTSIQTLVFQGVLVDSAMTRLKGEIASLVTAGTLTAAQQTLLQNLLTQVQTQAQAFFQAYLLKTGGTGTPAYGFLPQGDFDLLFTAPLGGAAAPTCRRSSSPSTWYSPRPPTWAAATRWPPISSPTPRF